MQEMIVAHQDGIHLFLFLGAEPARGEIIALDDFGEVTTAEVKDGNTGHEVFESCVVNVMANLAFDPPEGGALTVNYPFVFTTAEE